MQKSDPPRSFGVFKPAGHTVIVFRDKKAFDDAALQLKAAGLTSDAVTHYTPQEMLAQSQDDLEGASALASIGQELNLVKAQRELARKGCHFMVVPTDGDAAAQQVADLVRPLGALAAQHYGTLIVTDLIDVADGKGQVFESPDRGLDSAISKLPPQS